MKLFDDYTKNAKPIVKVQPEKSPFSTNFRQGDKNNAPVMKAQPEVSKLPLSKGRPTNADSARLQKAGRLPGRVSDGTENNKL